MGMLTAMFVPRKRWLVHVRSLRLGPLEIRFHRTFGRRRSLFYFNPSGRLRVRRFMLAWRWHSPRDWWNTAVIRHVQRVGSRCVRHKLLVLERPVFSWRTARPHGG